MNKEILARKVSFVALLLILVICCAGKLVEPPAIIINFPDIDKLPIKVDLRITEELLNAKLVVLTEGGFELPLGQVFSENSERLARHLFSQVSVVHDEASGADTKSDAILIPKVVSVTQTRPMLGYKNSVLLVVFEWWLYNGRGNLIWVDSILAKGVSPLASGASVRKGTQKRADKVTQDLFDKSFQAISSSEVIKTFASRM